VQNAALTPKIQAESEEFSHLAVDGATGID
jgi:hypothetical protein